MNRFRSYFVFFLSFILFQLVCWIFFFHSNFLIWMENVVGCTNLQYHFVTSRIYLQESYFSFWTTSLFSCRSRVFVYDPLQQGIFMELLEEDTRNKHVRKTTILNLFTKLKWLNTNVANVSVFRSEIIEQSLQLAHVKVRKVSNAIQNTTTKSTLALLFVAYLSFATLITVY